MDRRLLELLNDLAFSEHPEIPRLYQKYVDRETTAYIDFRKDHNGIAIVTNQPESEFAKPEGYERKPFGDKSCFATKEIWHVETTYRDKNLTRSQVKAFRSRSMGRGSGILTVEIRGEGTKIVF